MDLIQESMQREEFREILFDLAKSQDVLKNKGDRARIYMRLESLYYNQPPEKKFRHFYSDIFSVLTSIQQDSQLGDINILGQNLDVIRKGYTPKNESANGTDLIDISDSIKKLYDHVNLDIARINYSDAADRKVSGESNLENIQSKLKSIEADLERTNTVQKNNEKKLEKQQREYIAILGIFAAVILTFTGGIAFSTSVLNNIAQSSIYRIVCISLIIGLVLINVLYILFGYMSKLVDKEKTIKSPWIANIVIIALLILIGFAWLFGCVESRNAKIDKSHNASSHVIQERLEESEVTNSDMVSTQ